MTQPATPSAWVSKDLHRNPQKTRCSQRVFSLLQTWFKAQIRHKFLIEYFPGHITQLDYIRQCRTIRACLLLQKPKYSAGTYQIIGLRKSVANSLYGLQSILIYAKNKHENIPAHILKAVKEEITCP